MLGKCYFFREKSNQKSFNQLRGKISRKFSIKCGHFIGFEAQFCPYVQAHRSELYLQNYESQSQVIGFLKFTTVAQKPFILLSAMYKSSKLQIFDKGENRYVLCFSTTQFARSFAAKLPKKFFGSFFQKRTSFYFVTFPR